MSATNGTMINGSDCIPLIVTSIFTKERGYSIGNRKSRWAWQAVNEVSNRKSTSKAKLKAESQEKKHFKNLLGKSSKITDKIYHENYR